MRCRCGHKRVVHRHFHARTYCALCGCPWFTWRVKPWTGTRRAGRWADNWRTGAHPGSVPPGTDDGDTPGGTRTGSLETLTTRGCTLTGT